MPALEWLDADVVRSLHTQGTIEQVALQLAQIYPEKKDLSQQNLKKFMHENNIRPYQRLSQTELDEVVRTATDEVGGTYGRRMMQGYLRAQGVTASQRRIRAAQATVAPSYQVRSAALTPEFRNILKPNSFLQ